MVSFPLEHYEGDAGRTRAAGTAALKQRGVYDDLSSGIKDLTTAAGRHVTGAIEPAVLASSKGVANKAHDLGAASVLAAGALSAFAKAISIYDKKVDNLNTRYETAKAARFGVSSTSGATQGMSETEKRNAHGEAVDAADAELRRRLEEERRTAEEQLNEEGDNCADLLNKGPSQTAILSLVLSDDLPARDALPYVGMSLAALNNVRSQIGAVRAIHKLPKNWKLLAQYLLKINPKDLQGRLNMQTAMQMRQILLANKAQGLAFAERIATFKAGKVDAATVARNLATATRGKFLVDAMTPKAFFSETGKVGNYLKGTKFAGVNSVAGKALAPLGLAAGVYGVGDTISNWDKLSTEKRVTGIVGNGATAVAGGLGTAALIMAGTSMAFPPLGAAIAIGAGAVALGTLVYENREAIGKFSKDTWNGAVDTGEKVVEGVKDFAEDPGGTVKEGLGKVADGIGGLFD